jgi:enoyl-CoA hydratase/carnithine racemase
MSTRIAIRVDGAVAWLELDGADRLNAIGTQTYTDLAAAIRTLESQTSVRAVVVHGSGRAFCAGADIAEIQTLSGRDDFAAFLRGFTDALDVLVASPLPVIAAIHGSALGGGLELAMACDLRVATPDAALGLPEAKLGVLPGAGGTQRLPRLIPVGVATEMLMLGSVIDGERANALGLVNRLSRADTLLETAGGIGRATSYWRSASRVGYEVPPAADGPSVDGRGNSTRTRRGRGPLRHCRRTRGFPRLHRTTPPDLRGKVTGPAYSQGTETSQDRVRPPVPKSMPEA